MAEDERLGADRGQGAIACAGIFGRWSAIAAHLDGEATAPVRAV